MRYWLTVAIVFGVGCGGGGNLCKKACERIKSCHGDAGLSAPTCGLSAECTAREQCEAKCINAASCAALTGEDTAGQQSLLVCLDACASVVEDGGPPGDGGPADGLPMPDGPRPDGPPKFDGPCIPQCAGKQCGPDGCGGSCGSCTPPDICDHNFQCVCEPQCAGKQCGPDGCGGSCGSCTPPDSCDPSGQCIPPALNCGDIYICYKGCGSDFTCMFSCQGQGCASAQAPAQGLLDCALQLCASDCTYGVDTTCEACLQTSCASQFSTCMSHSC
jgi:hypothetical protein